MLVNKCGDDTPDCWTTLITSKHLFTCVTFLWRNHFSDRNPLPWYFRLRLRSFLMSPFMIITVISTLWCDCVLAWYVVSDRRVFCPFDLKMSLSDTDDGLRFAVFVYRPILTSRFCMGLPRASIKQSRGIVFRKGLLLSKTFKNIEDEYFPIIFAQQKF